LLWTNMVIFSKSKQVNHEGISQKPNCLSSMVFFHDGFIDGGLKRLKQSEEAIFDFTGAVRLACFDQLFVLEVNCNGRTD